MKNILRNLLIILCFSMLIVFGVSTQSQAAKVLQSSVKVEGEKKVKLSWKKTSASEYRIYRADTSGGKEENLNYRLIATVSGKKKSYTDKKVKANKEYYYKIKAYKKKNGKMKCVYESNSEWVYTGMETPFWGEYDHCDTMTTSEAIPLKIYLPEYTLHPTGIELYRKADGFSKYKKIKTVKLKKNQYTFQYTDRDVETGKNYYYKIRTYKVVKGKKVYSKYSQPLKLCAINHIGDYTMCTLTKGDQEVNSVEVSLTSNKGNGTMTFDSRYWYYSYTGEDLMLAAYSFDNKNWMAYSNKVQLKEGETIYLRFKAIRKDSFYFPQEASLWNEVDYSGYYYYCVMDFGTNQVDVCIDGEHYH